MNVADKTEHNISFQNLYILVPYLITSIEMYRKCGQPKYKLIGHWLKLV